MDLRDRRGCERLRIDPRKEIGVEVLADHRLDLLERNRRHLVDEPLELLDVDVRKQVGARREQLPELDVRRPELFERLAKRTRALGRRGTRADDADLPQRSKEAPAPRHAGDVDGSPEPCCTRTHSRKCYPQPRRLRHELRLDRRPQLVRGQRAFELRLDAAVAADEEDPRLALQPPLAHPAVVAARRVVVLVHLDVDEADAGTRELLPNVRDDVDDGTARPARAELRRRERDDKGPVGRELLRDRTSRRARGRDASTSSARAGCRSSTRASGSRRRVPARRRPASRRDDARRGCRDRRSPRPAAWRAPSTSPGSAHADARRRSMGRPTCRTSLECRSSRAARWFARTVSP